LGLADESYTLFTYTSDGNYGETEARAYYTCQQLKPKEKIVFSDLTNVSVLGPNGMVAQIINSPAKYIVVVTKHDGYGIIDIVNALINGYNPETYSIYNPTIPLVIPTLANGINTNQANAYIATSELVQQAIRPHILPITTTISANNTASVNDDTYIHKTNNIVAGAPCFNTYAQYSQYYTTAYQLDQNNKPYYDEITFPLIWELKFNSNIAVPQTVLSANVHLGYMISSDISQAIMKENYINVPYLSTGVPYTITVGNLSGLTNINNTNDPLGKVNAPPTMWTIQNYYYNKTPMVTVDLLTNQVHATDNKIYEWLKEKIDHDINH